VGTQKGGTTFLWEYLKKNSAAQMSAAKKIISAPTSAKPPARLRQNNSIEESLRRFARSIFSQMTTQKQGRSFLKTQSVFCPQCMMFARTKPEFLTKYDYQRSRENSSSPPL
jgi:hypothetical protein